MTRKQLQKNPSKKKRNYSFQETEEESIPEIK